MCRRACAIMLFFVLIIIKLQTVESTEEKHDDSYRDYSETSQEHVKAFYRDNHARQTVDFVRAKHEEFLPLRHGSMSMWEAFELIGQVIDESDPDMHLPQYYHCYQTAEALRNHGEPRWLILVGLIHDMGKMLAYYDLPQWAVVGDTFPLGCAFSDKVVFSEYFPSNPDIQQALYQTEYGIYEPNCGLENVLMSWGHDEYLYQVVKDYLPKEASYIVRFHSFYAAHREGAYRQLMNEYDCEMMPLLKFFSEYDLYSKEEEVFDAEALKPYYQALMAEFFPDPIKW